METSKIFDKNIFKREQYKNIKIRMYNCQKRNNFDQYLSLNV